MTDEILNDIVVETNRYAYQLKEKTNFPKSRLHSFVDTSKEELEEFLGLILWMGLARFPSLSDYWSKSVLYQNEVKNKMPRNRFELLLRTLHFCNNENPNVEKTDRLRKISPLLEKLKERYMYAMVPGVSVCVDETLVPFRGRLLFRQYIRNKRHKFGIKLYKLCLAGGYTYNITIYCGKDKVEGDMSASTKVVVDLMHNLLDSGRTLYTDNYYTSVSLAHKLLDRKTHLVGTLRANRRLNCKEVVHKQLSKGQTIAKESNTGIVQLKWKDKRDVLTLSTKHTDEKVKTTTSRGEEKDKPAIIVDYNKSKSFIDISDQLKAYNSCLRRGVKWYRKLSFEFLLGTTIINAHCVYTEVTQKKMSVTEFKQMIAISMLGLDKQNTPNTNTPKFKQEENHILRDIKIRRRCVVCYVNVAAEIGPKAAQSRTPRSTYACATCQKTFCLTCFFIKHKSSLF